MKKILFVATIFKHFRAFHIPYIKWFKDQGWQVDVMANGDDILPIADNNYIIPIDRSPFSINNIKAVKQAKSIIENQKYDIIYCHTAMGAVIARIAAMKARQKLGTKVIYVAHGFHFFKGGPIKSWLLYYPIEKFLSRYTDAIVTINQEDFDLVKNHRFRNQFTFKIPGIGLNTSRLIITSENIRHNLRKEYGYLDSDFILIYVAEYIHRKNHRFIIKALPMLLKRIPNIRILFAGRGRLMENMQNLAASLNVTSYIDFLGFRQDIGQLIALSDVGISASRQEGLGLNIAEEMYSGLPVVASDDRGHRELIIPNKTGFIFPQQDQELFVKYIETLYRDQNLRNRMGISAREHVQQFSIENAIKNLSSIYRNFM